MRKRYRRINISIESKIDDQLESLAKKYHWHKSTILVESFKKWKKAQRRWSPRL